MNERIRELAEQAGVLADYGEDIKEGRYSIGGSYQSMEKFAELIVQKCADIGALYADGNYEVYNQIMAHFGLEEE